MNDITHLTQMISLRGQRLDTPLLSPQDRFEILKELDELVYKLESHLRDELYPLEETIDGQYPHPF